MSGMTKAEFEQRVSMIKDERDKFREFATEGVLAAYGFNPEKQNEYSGYSLPELARHACTIANQDTGGNVAQVIGRALGNTDFPIILSNVANKSLLDSYTAASETWQIWCDKGSVRDFKPQTLVGASETEGLDEVKEMEHYKYGEMAEKKETFTMSTYGKIFSFSRHAIVNDDLGALLSAMAARGEAAARKVGDLAYSVLTTNAAMADGTPLFHANHSNLGTMGAVSETTLGAGIAAMGLQKDLLGERRLNIRPRFFICPLSQEALAETYFSSVHYSDSDTGSTRSNIYGGNYFTRVYDARLDDHSTTAWYLAGDKGKTVKVFFLAGQEKPHLEQQQGWEADGIEFKIRLDAAAKALDWRSLHRNPGA